MSELYKSVHLYPPFHERDALAYSLRTGLVGLGAGLFSACMKNAFFTTSTSPWTVVTQYGSTIPIYGINCTNVVADNKPPQLEAMDSSKQAWPTFEKRMMDGMNSPEDFPLALSGECSVLLTPIYSANLSGRQKISNIIAVSVLAGTVLGVYTFAGGIGGLSTISGVDVHEALEYRRKWRFYPTNIIPLEDYEQAIGRRAHPEDFADIAAVMPAERPVIYTDVVGISPPPGVKKEKQWWQDVLEKARGEANEEVKE
jgi:hypothetical protein